MKTHFLVIALLLVQGITCGVHAVSQRDISGPAGSTDFGTRVNFLPNGNFVVTDPTWSQVSPSIANAGAVYLYKPDGTLISTLRGGTANNRVGNLGIIILPNGHFVVRSELWDNTSPAATDAGAVTWGNADTGFGAAVVTVSAANSLVGGTTNDHVGMFFVTTLSNGNYVVPCPDWDIPAGAANVGAATFCLGTGGTTGLVTTANSLTGSTAGDQISFYGIRPVAGGNYLVIGHLWDGPGGVDTGAVTWCSGTTGFPFGSGSKGVAVSAANSLVGSSANDNVGILSGVLPTGNCVLISYNWDNPTGPVADVGAVTFVQGLFGAIGPLSSANSLIGSSAGDQVGLSGITELSTGDYVVISTEWDIPGGNANVGAITRCSGTGGAAGVIGASNSLIGSSVDDRVGSYSVYALSNGNYVVASGDWDNPAGAADVGAVTWRPGTGVSAGTVTAANSLIGSTLSDNISSGGIITLNNGNYVISSPDWDNGAEPDAGAATWGNGTTGVTGAIASTNSLVGTDDSDRVSGDGIEELANGHYVVISSDWDHPNGTSEVGAVTWGNGTKGIKGAVTTSNSLHGKTAGDSVGSDGVHPLTNGHYVVTSNDWDLPGSPSIVDAGAATWGNGTTGIKGAVTAANSLHGTATNDQVGRDGAEILTNGHYIVRSTRWNSGLVTEAGAVTWGNGNSGVKGPVTTANSLVGTTSSDRVGGNLRAQSDGACLITSNSWDQTNPPTSNSGALTLVSGTGTASGPLSMANSVFGTAASEGGTMTFAYDPSISLLVAGRPGDNKITLFGNQFRSLAKTNASAPGALDIAYSKPGAAAINSSGDTLFDYKLIGAGSTSGRNQALFSGDDLVLQSGANLSALGTGLPPNAKLLTLLNPVYHQTGRALFQATFSGTGISSVNNKLLLMDNGTAVQVLRRTGQTLAEGVLFSSIPTTFHDVLQSLDQNLITVGYTLKTEASTPVTISSDTGVLLMDHTGDVLSNLLAREGEAAFGTGGGTFGQFTGRAAAGLGTTLHFTAAYVPPAASAVNALFSMTSNGVTTTRAAEAKTDAPGSGGADFSTFTGLTQRGTEVLFKATLAGATTSTNEGIWSAPANTLLLRKGDTILPGLTVSKIIRFWPAGALQLIAHLQFTSGPQALALKQSDGNWLILLQTGTNPAGIDSAKISSINAVEVNPVNGRYVALTTLSGAPSSANQVLWTGNTALGADTPATSQAARLPLVRLRKGERFSTIATPLGIVKGITLKPAPDTTGAGGRGLAQVIGSGGSVVVQVLGDRNLTELLVIP